VLLGVHGVDTSHEGFSGVLFDGAGNTTHGDDVGLGAGEVKGSSGHNVLLDGHLLVGLVLGVCLSRESLGGV